MRLEAGKLILLPLLACILVVSLGAAVQAKESAWLGVVLQEITDEIREAMELDVSVQGVLISDVVDDSPADEHGIEDGDIIMMIGDVKTLSVEEAVDAVRAGVPGDKVDVVVMRDGNKKTIMVELGGRDLEAIKKIEMFDFVMPEMGHMPEMGRMLAHSFMKPHGYLGVRVSEISGDLGDYFGVKAREGVLVLEVINDSPAEYAGLKDGDVILSVDGKELKGPDRLVKYMEKCEPGEKVEVTYKRNRRTRTVTVELEGAPGKGMSRMGKGHGMDRCGKKKVMIMGQGEPGSSSKKHRIIIKSDGDVRTIEIPDMDIDLDFEDLEDLMELEALKDIKVYHLDSDDLKQEIEELQGEIEQLRKDVEELRKP